MEGLQPVLPIGGANLSRGITPSVEQLTLLSAQLLAIAAATEASSQASKRKIGFR